MKKFVLILILVSFFVFNTRAQTLQNTYWRWYDALNVLHGYVLFGQDTFYFSFNLISYDTIATFTTSGNLYTVVDMPFIACLTTDTGRYTFLIQVDTLRFTAISDSCTDRYNELTTTYFVRLYLGIEGINPFSTASVYPNPSADGIFNLSFASDINLPDKIYVLSADGRKISHENFLAEQKNYAVNLQSYAPGIYFLVMEHEKGRKIVKLVR